MPRGAGSGEAVVKSQTEFTDLTPEINKTSSGSGIELE